MRCETREHVRKYVKKCMCILKIIETLFAFVFKILKYTHIHTHTSDLVVVFVHTFLLLFLRNKFYLVFSEIVK